MLGTISLKMESEIAEIIDAKLCPRKWQKTKSRLTYGTPCITIRHKNNFDAKGGNFDLNYLSYF